MSKRNRVVRVALFHRTDPVGPVGPGFVPYNGTPQDRTLMLLEWLRYAGIITVISDTAIGYVFDLKPPAHITSQTTQESWAESNASRIRSFGFNAATAFDTDPATNFLGELRCSDDCSQ